MAYYRERTAAATALGAIPFVPETRGTGDEGEDATIDDADHGKVDSATVYLSSRTRTALRRLHPYVVSIR